MLSIIGTIASTAAAVADVQTVVTAAACIAAGVVATTHRAGAIAARVTCVAIAGKTRTLSAAAHRR